MNAKKSIAIVVALLLLFGLTACGVKNDAIVGKWYNQEGKCLDVRSDGSWKLEGSYGTGTWKQLDNESYEFTDYYGDTQESEIMEDESGEYINFGYYGNFYKSVSKTEKSDVKTDGKEDGQIQKTLKKMNSFNCGVAWVSYIDPNTNKEMFGLIDSTGKILYEDEFQQTKFYDFKGEVGYFSQGDMISLINIKGKIIATSEKNDFDKVVGYGDDIFLVYKNKSSISSKEHLYTVIDKNGKTLFTPVDLGDDPDSESAYLGCGIFMIEGEDYEKILFNYKTKKKIFIHTKTSASNIEFVNNNAYFANNVYVSETGDFSLSTNNSYYLLNTNFQRNEIEYFNYITDGVTVQCNGYYLPHVEYVSITDRKTNIKTEIRDYPANQIRSISFNGEYGTIMITGKDGKSYFSLIDRRANFKFDPICGSSAVYSEGYIRFKNEDKTWGITDTNGKVLANNLKYKEIKNFNNGIALAVTDKNESVYIDSSGKIIYINLH